jgi:FKBP-type peptidyl-prolyl cis-trans isomerase 2
MNRIRGWALAALAATGLGLGTGHLAWGEPPTRIVDGTKVTMEFTVTLPDRTVVTTTDGREPLAYIHGRGQIVPGLEKALTGLKVGDKKHVELPPEQAYGAYDETMRLTVQKNRIPGDAKVGSVLQDKTGQPIRVIELTENSAVLDRNHPLAGKTVTFDVRIIKLEEGDATP